MTRPTLSLVPDPSEDPGERSAMLQAQAKAAASDHMGAWTVALHFAGKLSGEIAQGGENYPVGARELARGLSQRIANDLRTLQALIGRTNP